MTETKLCRFYRLMAEAEDANARSLDAWGEATEVSPSPVTAEERAGSVEDYRRMAESARENARAYRRMWRDEEAREEAKAAEARHAQIAAELREVLA